MFVSHSSCTTEEQGRLGKLVNDLGTGEGKVDVLYDQEVITGTDEWRKVINLMLAGCDAAVILITPDALKSSWVLKEATILRWRHDWNPEFNIFVSVTADRAELETSRLWDPVRLPDIQFVSCDAAEIAAYVKEKLAGLAAQLQPTPLDLLTDEIAFRLSKALPSFLQKALNSLDEPVPVAVGDLQRHLAYAITKWVLRQPPPALAQIATTLTHLGRVFPPEDAMGILEAVAPMWVELDSASWFMRADCRNPSFRGVAITCKRPDPTLQQYVDRAYRPSLPPRVRFLNGVTGGAHADDVIRELRNVVRDHLERRSGRSKDDSEIDEYLQQKKVCLYFALPLPDDHSVVGVLRDRYPSITFIFFARPEIYPPDKTPPVAAGVGWVTPAHKPELEDQVVGDYADAMDMFWI